LRRLLNKKVNKNSGGNSRLRFRFALLIVLVVNGLSGWAPGLAQETPATPADAQLQRLQRLKEQADRNPGNKPFLYDYMQALEEARRDAELFALLPRVDIATAPPAALSRLGRAASNLKLFPQDVDIFREVLRRAPGRPDAVAGIAYALIDGGQPAEAVAVLEERRKIVWTEVALLEAYAEALVATREHVRALPVYERILQLEPGNREAQRNRIFTVARLGAQHRALELAQAAPGLLSGEELFALRSDRAAVATRWGTAADSDSPERFAGTDAALEENAQLLAEADASGQPEAAVRRLQFDRIVLLRNRVRMQDAVDVHERLVGQGVEVAPYAQVAAADAYLYLRQPEKARDLYLAAQSRGELDFSAKVGLFYAYSDAEQHEQALAQIDRLTGETPERIKAYSPLTITDNPDYASAVATAAAARSYQDRPHEAQLRLEELRDLAPWHMESREKLATVYNARGWPRRAEQEYEWILAAEPRYRAARVGYADTLRELRDWEAAQREAAALEDEFPEDGQVRRVSRQWQIHQMRELQVEAGTGRSSGAGGPQGSREHRIETRLYSAPIARDWRAFLHQYEARATFDAGVGFRRRIGAGMEYRIRDWRASAEVSDSYNDGSDVGLSLAGDWWADDHWNVEAALDTSSNDVPLQGRQSGVRGWSLRAGVGYRVSESRSFRVGAQHIEFTDGNRREILSAGVSQRLVTGPVFKLDGVLGLYTSRNSLDGAAYFNPGRDLAIDLTLIGEQRLWRRYDRSFLHRLHLSLGSYDQQGFGGGATRGIRYEHEWNFDGRLSLLYGAQRTLHPYDGQDEYANYYNAALNWRF
jgi:biofilm PGA synthesis protein PgaA